MSTAGGGTGPTDGWPELDATVQRIAVRVLRRGEVSRAELARETGLSTGSLTRVTKPLLAAGIVTEGSARPGGSGRPSLPLRVNAARASFVGVNLTADTAYAVRTDLQGTVLDTAELALPDRSPVPVVDQLAGLVRRWQRDGPPLTAVGVALGGHVRDWRTVTSATYLGWQEVDLGGGLGARTGLPVVVGNDVHALTQAAHLFGPGRGVSSLAVVTVGVGVGAGAISHDQLLVGHPGQAGDVGHLPLEGGTSPCLGADHVGCAVAELSTSALEQEAGRRLGRPVALAELVGLAGAGDPRARVVVDRAARMLGTLAGTVAAVLGPELVLLSGDGIAVALAAPEEVRAGLARVLPAGPRPELVIDPVFSFHTWAHGAAGTAILHALTGRLPR
ncbi:ROK family protein [Auraticoccus monumenti]|uniref:ROK family protein n=1 Tax=Auraticoccus monumenti TaxID=675864 RepID=UPI0012FA989A|nr:ROK family protein [Auraticoccus monumenti]